MKLCSLFGLIVMACLAGCALKRAPAPAPATPQVITIFVTVTPAAPTDVVFVQAGNQALAVDEQGETRFSLPAGLRAADGASTVAASAEGVFTYDMRSGAVTNAIRQTGLPSLRVIAPGGGWAALQNDPGDVLVLNMASGRARLIRLEGAFTPLAFSANGEWLYVREQPAPASPALFNVFRLHLADETAAPQRLTLTGDSAPASGHIVQSAYTPNGASWLALMRDPANALAYLQCIALDSGEVMNVYLPVTGADESANAAYRLVAGADGAAYAFNPASGVAAHIDTERRALATFARFTPPTRAATATPALAAAADGEAWFAIGRTVWVYDSARAALGAFSLPQDVIGLSAAGNNRALLVLADGSVTSLFGYTAQPAR